jgi:hypothetical protein
MFVASVILLSNGNTLFFVTSGLTILFVLLSLVLYVVQKDISEYIQSQAMQRK